MTRTAPEVRVISIGTLAANPLWEERFPVRTGHATTTLIRLGDRVILVDPGLPDRAVAARLTERAGIPASAVTHVFLTSFKPDVFRGILAFEKAKWWISQDEREQVGVPLVGQLQEAAAAGDAELKAALELDVGILRRCEPAPDEIAPHVSLFPLPGVTPGLTGLLVAMPGRGGSGPTVLIAGDAVPTVEHLERGMVLDSAVNVTRARESFGEAVEIADLIVPGRDNLVVNPVKVRTGGTGGTGGGGGPGTADGR
ncbi:MAG: MBL fold metallo-hydrolase [Phycisphaeraceae bacterium]|nr:MBL fold metallo-hydrolase [Phycisphaeraceae bacterium]